MRVQVHIVILTFLCGLLISQFSKYESAEPLSYQKTHSMLNRIIRLDASSEESMLQLNNHQLSNYDQLMMDIKELNRVYVALTLQLSGQSSLKMPLQKLRNSIERQTGAANRFKSEFGILINSQRYLSLLVQQNMESHPFLAKELLRLKGNLFEFLAFPDSALKKDIIRQQQGFQENGLKNLVSHVDVLLKYAPLIQKRIDTVVHCETAKHVYHVSDVYDAIHDKHMLALENNRFWLFALAASLAFYLAIIFYALVRSARKVEILNERLTSNEKRLEHELKAKKHSERRYRTLIDASSAAIMTYSENRFVSANHATLQMFGIDDESDILSMSAAEVSPPLQPDGQDSAITAQGYIEKAMKEGSCSFEWLHQRRNGDTFPAHVQLTAIEVDGQRMLQAVVTDVSILHQLQKEKEQLVEALEHTAEPVVITDVEARIIYVNLAFEALTGYAADEITGKFASILRSETVDPRLYTNMLHTVNEGKVWKGETFIHCKSGDEILAERTVSPILDANGAVVSHVVIMHDITEQTENARKLEHTQRLESLGVLAGGIAHDFNNILTAIMGNAALAERSLDITSPARGKLATIEASAQRAADLCQQMLAYSGKGNFVVKTINLSGLTDEMLHLIEVSIEKNVVIKYHLTDNLPAVDVDVAQIQQVILNLITNANEAIGHKSGVISFSTGVMHADRSYLDESFCDDGIAEGRFVYIEVSDTGCGMNREIIEKIFDPFFTTKFTGRGLGMSAVLGIVRGHHGALRVYSEPGKGTTFKMLLPASDGVYEKDVQVADESDGWKASGSILVVDDEETIREVAAMMLEEMGFSTLTASDGVEAVEIYRRYQKEISAVVLDMTMPRMDGKVCFRELRRINRDVKVILSSGYSEEDATSRFQGQGLAGFIQKPYLPESLKSVVKKL